MQQSEMCSDAGSVVYWYMSLEQIPLTVILKKGRNYDSAGGVGVDFQSPSMGREDFFLLEQPLPNVTTL